MHFPVMARDPYQALRFREYRLLLIGSFVAAVGEQMLTLAIGWELYERTHSAFLLGLVGLIQLFPALLLLPYGGFAADRYSRKRILVLAQAVLIIASLGLAAVSLWHGALVLVYVCLLLIGSATAFITPASTALLAQIVPEDVFENAATWSSSSWQLATVIGPALGGLMLAWISSSAFIYVLHAVMALTFALLLLPLRVRPLNRRDQQGKERHAIWRSLGEGVSFLRHTPILLAAMTLDLFAVLFGGATTLLPVFADELLRVGPEGLGWLRAAPSIGALCMAFFVAHRPPLKRAGFTLLLSVIGFGVATILFGLSRSFWLSLLVLFLLGGLDNLSVVIRETLALTRTPDEMRGRVAALNGLFVNASSQLGGFESGLTAQLFGPTLSVVGGGVGTILVVLIVALIWPELRRLRTLREVSAPSVQDVLQQEDEV
ncbi:putative MFS family arabinose efflux permease [Thermosporothrix hazakensis]|jgi:MFS family permease|uniref:Multidrug efflux pump Tap n=1 Tax=Thermosporothrix hazakensis TaxID=644383 RepID=A0A326TNZ9_THEHA|nr:MFS transporter [Thermosporothrix hazakensis]PZW18216.1 putative MFS family arabinose efflux permease [Thermosporothrix hazakensis]GCE50337.1 MFS transporter [Thermosporothrix hazakensis]